MPVRLSSHSDINSQRLPMSIYLRAQIDKSILRGYWWIDGAPQNQYRMLARRVHDVATVESKFDELK